MASLQAKRATMIDQGRGDFSPVGDHYNTVSTQEWMDNLITNINNRKILTIQHIPLLCNPEAGTEEE